MPMHGFILPSSLFLWFPAAESTDRQDRVHGGCQPAQMVFFSISTAGSSNPSIRNVNVSHITSGFMYNSPANSKVRVDESFDLNIGTSVFDFKNTSHGLVSNTLITYSPSLAAKPAVFQDYVNSDFPLFTADILQTGQAVFTGMVEREYNGMVASVSKVRCSKWETG